MVPDSTNSPEEDSAEANCGQSAHDATEDTLIDMIGTILLVAVSVILIVAGGQAIIWSLSPLGMAAGVAVTVFGVYLVAATLELVPPVREWV
ncbi:hypothetical protein [Haloplanus halobius]|uniref:hypothetical protein n=1 Tax=Haloplanus halobius TaxID=2934938 RepID=UPI00200BC44B|nr:hypothetical protein [Haloplanus sp. XH21]